MMCSSLFHLVTWPREGLLAILEEQRHVSRVSEFYLQYTQFVIIFSHCIKLVTYLI